MNFLRNYGRAVTFCVCVIVFAGIILAVSAGTHKVERETKTVKVKVLD